MSRTHRPFLVAALTRQESLFKARISSAVGARGLMQVMPFHRGQWKPCEPRLDDIDANIQKLEALVTERTASLREAIAQMEEFSYSVSHDLRSPLTAILTAAEPLGAAGLGPGPDRRVLGEVGLEGGRPPAGGT